MVCGASSSAVAVVRTIVDRELEPDHPLSLVTVATHRLDGTLIATSTTDARGCASVASEPGAYLSFVHGLYIVTTTAPSEAQLVVRFGWWVPLPPMEPCIAGQLRIEPEAPVVVDYGWVYLGCAYIEVPAFPATIDVPEYCLGSDDAMDVIVGRTRDTGVLSPGGGTFHDQSAEWQHVDLGDGSATIRPTWVWPGYQQPPEVEVTIDGTPYPFNSETTLFAGGYVYGGSYRPYQPAYAAGLPVDRTRVKVWFGSEELADRSTWLNVPGISTQIEMTSEDFLAPIGGEIGVVDSDRFALQWPAETTDADVLVGDILWTWPRPEGPLPLEWVLILPPSATEITFPRIPSLTGMLPSFDPPNLPEVFRTLIDGSTLNGFADVMAGGFYLNEMSVVDPAIPRIRRAIASSNLSL